MPVALFVPGDRPDRFQKAIASGADIVILDLEDAVSLDRKSFAREAVRNALAAGIRACVRVNVAVSELGIADLTMLSEVLADSVMLPKVSGPRDLDAARETVRGTPFIVLVETIDGMRRIDEIAPVPGVVALAFGGYDLCAELGARPHPEVLAPWRSRTVFAARSAGIDALDMPFAELDDDVGLAADARRAVDFGFDGKLAIHPKQIAAIHSAFAPSAAEVDRARKIVDAAAAGGVVRVNGTMIDPPLVAAVTAQSGAPLGMLRFPLRYGERVIDVAGSVGWRIESEELVLPTQGKSAEITISGTLSNVASFAPDARAPFEWWLLESDAEHRVLAAGDAKQHDIGESPLARREPNSRLFLVQRGQHLEVTVQTLQSLDVLAATIRTHTRVVIVTASGDVVTQDLLAYDNSGIDYLYYSPDGKPVFLATDGNSERVMHKDGSEDLMVPMRLGQHTITVQTLSQASLGALFGRLTVTGPRVPLATGSEDVTVGLPATVHPMIVIGGEQSTWPVSLDDAVGGALALVASLLAFRGWKKRSLAALTLVGLWFVSKAAVACILGGGVLVMLWPILARLSKTPRRIGMALALLATVVVGVPVLSMKSDRSLMPAAGPVAAVVVDKSEDRQAADMLPAFTQQQVMGNHNAPIGGNVADSITRAGMVDGVRPVAVSLPSYGHSAFASQQLVTPARAFTPSVYYVTDTAIALAGLLWLACAALLGWMTRSTLLAFRDRLRAALAPKPTAPITEPTPAE